MKWIAGQKSYGTDLSRLFSDFQFTDFQFTDFQFTDFQFQIFRISEFQDLLNIDISRFAWRMFLIQRKK